MIAQINKHGRQISFLILNKIKQISYGFLMVFWWFYGGEMKLIYSLKYV